MDIIYCAGRNKQLMQIAKDTGFLLGIRSDSLSYGFDIKFVDIEYERPDFKRHLEVISAHHPRYAIVPDLSEKEVSGHNIKRALMQYDQLSKYCEIPLIVPKLPSQIEMLPAEIAIGYSVPTSYGGAQYPIWELAGRQVHLLGGSPHAQMELYRYISACAEVISVDGNMAQKMATKFSKIWKKNKWHFHPQCHTNTPDLYQDCFRQSCMNIQDSWSRLLGVPHAHTNES